MKNLLLILVTTIVLASCGLDTREFYFKLEDFEERKVYKLTCKEDSTRTIYAEMFSDPSTQLLTTINYDYQLNKTIEFVEKYNDEGAELITYRRFYEVNGEIFENEFEVLETDVMLWSVKDKPFSYRVKSSPASGYEGEINNARTYIARAHIDAMGEKYEVLNFKDVISFSDSPEVFVSNRYYARDLGIVAIDYEEFGTHYVLILEDILSGEEWDDLLALSAAIEEE